MKSNRTPRILFFDIETTPVKAWIWRTGKQVVRHPQIVFGQKFDIICICYKWLGEGQTHALSWDSAQSSAKMISDFTKIIESADIVITQNGDAFDIKHVNTQRLLHGQTPISWPTSEDTKKMLKKHFYLTSASLDYVSKLLTGSGKSRMEFGDWTDIIEKKSKKALNKMIRYCKRDVVKLSRVWKKIAPYCDVRASRAQIIGREKNACPLCASKDTIKYGFRYLKSNIMQRMICQECAHTFCIPRTKGV